MTPLRIAVIDDEPLARAGVLARLQRHANLLVVAEFGDGANARAGIAALHPDLLFLDVQMPGLSGLELLAAMPAQQRPVTILLTAHSQFALRAFELQVIDYLLKPIDDSRFDEALARARNAVQAKRLGPSMTATATDRKSVV